MLLHPFAKQRAGRVQHTCLENFQVKFPWEQAVYLLALVRHEARQDLLLWLAQVDVKLVIAEPLDRLTRLVAAHLTRDLAPYDSDCLQRRDLYNRVVLTSDS